MKKIVITGPESTGKTTLAVQLAETLHTVWVPEYARQYLDELGRPYTADDLPAIAEGQLWLEESICNTATDYLVCDTDLITLYIWSEVRFGQVHPYIKQQVMQRHYDFYLLCAPDFPWAPDPLREDPENREVLFERYRKMLELLGKPFQILQGGMEERLAGALEAVKEL